MVNLQLEVIGGIAWFLYALRWVFQYRATKKQGIHGALWSVQIELFFLSRMGHFQLFDLIWWAIINIWILVRI